MLFSCLLLGMITAASSVDTDFARSHFVAPLKNVLPRSRRQAPSEVLIPKITDMFISSKVSSRFATVRVSSKVANTEDIDLEATFSVQIPESAFIANFTMVINDTFQVSKVYEKKEAQKKYDKAKEEGQSAGQVRHQERDVARGMDIFNVNVNVAARSDVYFELTYQELLERKLGLYVQRIIVQPVQIVDNLTLDLFYNEPQQFDRFSYKEPNGNDVMTTSSEFAVLKASTTTRRIVYKPSASKQRQMNAEKGIDGEFVVSYDVGHGFNGGNIIYAEENDYFVHYFAVDKSEQISALSKNIMFVIDISGSMGGRKIEQARDAMKEILPQLSDIDFFNIMVFDDNQLVWLRDPIRATIRNINTAKRFVDKRVRANGGTNINGALIESVKLVANDPELSGKAGIIVFLTDGQPTAGETDISEIRKNVKGFNENRVGVFSLGFGQGVDFEFLQQVSWENGGFARRIYEESDAANQLTNFFKEISSPLLLDLEFIYQTNQVDTSQVTRTMYKQMFSGTEIVVAGKKRLDRIDATVQGSTATNKINLVVPDNSKTRISGPSGEFTEKLWAYLTIKDLLRKKAIAATDAEATDLEARALNMSVDYNFVTPLTSLLVVQEDQNHNQQENSMPKPAGGIKRKQSYGTMHMVKNAGRKNALVIQHSPAFAYDSADIADWDNGGGVRLDTLPLYCLMGIAGTITFIVQSR